MGWADHHIAKLKQGQTVQFRPKGHSMTGKVNNGNLCTVEPVKTLSVGMIVLCKVAGNQYLHLVTGLDRDRVQIGNNKGHINGWTSINQVFGVCVKVEP